MTLPLDTASSLLLWSNVIYVVGAVLTLGTSALVLFEKRQVGMGIEVKHSVRNEVSNGTIFRSICSHSILLKLTSESSIQKIPILQACKYCWDQNAECIDQ